PPPAAPAAPAPQPAPAPHHAPATPQATGPQQAPAPPQAPRAGHAPVASERLADAFEGLQDLFFLQSPLDGTDFVNRLLVELIPCEASSIALYDINSNEMRFVSMSGPGGNERKGEAIPTSLGLIGQSLLVYGRCLRIDDVTADDRFDAGIDGRVGLEVATMLLKPIHLDNRLLGIVQLLNRTNDFSFSSSDESVLGYVTDKLGEFLARTKASADRPSKRAPRR
ncbi:MAG: GAF domain-containing protein, partial [Deltaproteobacteria bacterium]